MIVLDRVLDFGIFTHPSQQGLEFRNQQPEIPVI